MTQNSPSERGSAGAVALVVLGLILLVVLPIGVWAFRVATSDVKGAGDAQITKNSASNRIAAQERFEARYQEVLATDRKIDQAAADRVARPEDPIAGINYTGLVNHCNEVVGEYNAAARQYTQQEFRAIDLPAQIDGTDPSTDCKETAK